MATFKAYVNGATMGRPGSGGARAVKRGCVNGWSRDSVRRHLRWLYSVDCGGLDGEGVGITLTVRDTPPDHVEWSALVRRLQRSMREAGLVRWHWVVEWQRRGTPHLHMAVYGPSDWSPGETRREAAASGASGHPARSHGGSVVGAWVVDEWLRLAAEYAPGRVAQAAVPITGAEGWLRYLSKHASRGVAHYQRQGTPDGWTGTGRLWGHGGSWPVVEPVAGLVDDATYRRARRWVRSYVVAQARTRALELEQAGRSAEALAAWRRVSWARRMLRCNDVGLSSVRGVSAWVPGPVLLTMLDVAGWSGEVV